FSLNVSLLVNVVPSIVTGPVSQTICYGSSLSIPVTASGSNLTYQWRIGTVNLTNGGNISGATSSVLVINPINLSNAGTNYNVVITGACSPSVVSSNFSIF